VLTMQHREEALSRAYVQAIAARAGLSLTWLTVEGIQGLLTRASKGEIL